MAASTISARGAYVVHMAVHTSPYVALHGMTWFRCATLHYAALRCTPLHYAALRCPTLHYARLHRIASHRIRSRCRICERKQARGCARIPRTLGGFKGFATKGQFRKCGLTCLLFKVWPTETRQGCATRLWKQNEQQKWFTARARLRTARWDRQGDKSQREAKRDQRDGIESIQGRAER